MRIATAVDVAYLLAWALMLQPVLQNRLQFYRRTSPTRSRGRSDAPSATRGASVSRKVR